MSNRLEFRLFSLLDRIKKTMQPWANQPSVLAWLEEIDAQLEHIADNRYRVAVVGEFKRGKSSLINTLLQHEILPADVLPTTATFNRVVYGDVPRAILRMKDGSKREVPIDSIAAYITKLTEASEAQAREIEEAVVEYPSMFCSNHVELIDTPGLNDDEEMTRVTVSRLTQIDLAIVTVSALYPFSRTEAEFVARLLETSSVSQVLFAITMIDLVRPREIKRVSEVLKERIQANVLEILQRRHEPDDPVMEKYGRILGNPRVFLLSAEKAQQALRLQNEELYIASGYRHFTAELPRILLEGQRWGMRQHPLFVGRTVVEKFLGYAGGWARLSSDIGALCAFRRRAASVLYSLSGMRSERGRECDAWLRIVGEACDGLLAVKTWMLDRYRESWEAAPDTIEGHTLAVLQAMPTVYSHINAQIRELLGGACLDRMLAASNDLIDGAIKDMEIPQNLQGFADDIRALCEDARPEPLFAEMKKRDSGAEPRLFYWRKSPIAIAPNVAPNVFYAFACRSAQESLEACAADNQNALEGFVEALSKSRRLQIENLVRGIFSKTREAEQELQVRLEAEKRLGIDQETVNRMERLRKECCELEALVQTE